MARPGGPTVRRMPEFLAETYTPRLAAAPSAAGLARAAAQVSGHGAPVCFLAAINVPAEETCFYLYHAPTAAAVRAAMTGARLRPERITLAVSIRPPDPAPGKQAGTGQARSWLPTTHPSIPVWSTIMPAPARSPRSRPHGAPAYYLARPASLC